MVDLAMSGRAASRFAYAAVGLFAVGIALGIATDPPETFVGAPPASVVATTLALILYHLAMLPVIAAVPSPTWARGSGFAWVVVDNVLEMMSLFGEGAELVVPMRWGVHLATATWIIGAAWSHRGAVRLVGAVLTVVLVGISLAGPFIADPEVVPQTLGPGAVLFMVWIVLVGGRLRTSA
jgi:hypothetical protein